MLLLLHRDNCPKNEPAKKSESKLTFPFCYFCQFCFSTNFCFENQFKFCLLVGLLPQSRFLIFEIEPGDIVMMIRSVRSNSNRPFTHHRQEFYQIDTTLFYRYISKVIFMMVVYFLLTTRIIIIQMLSSFLALSLSLSIFLTHPQ